MRRVELTGSLSLGGGLNGGGLGDVLLLLHSGRDRRRRLKDEKTSSQ